MLAGAAALGFTGPALAKPGHGFGANGHGHAYGADDEERFGARDRDADDLDEQDGLDEDGVARQAFGYGVGGCPPGLAKKTPACVPPGLARQLQQQQVLGQRALGYGVPYGGYANPYGAYGYSYGGAPVPYGAYSPYAAPVPYGGYGYGAPYSGHPYQVDPRTMLLQQVIGALSR